MRPIASQLRSPDVADVASSTVAEARALFAQHFDAAGETEKERSVYQQAPLAVQADHTHYSGGFALFAALPYGVAVVARPTTGVSRVAESDAPARVAVSPDTGHRPDDSITVRVVRALLQACRAPAPALDIAVAHALPDCCRDAYVAALTRALHRALLQVANIASEPSPFGARPFSAVAHDALSDAVSIPYSLAYPLAVSPAAHPDKHLAPFVLVDTPAGEALPVPSEHASSLRWGFFDAGATPFDSPDVHYDRRTRVEEALAALRATRDFADLDGFSTLEHESLDRALNQVDPVHQPVVRHLVTENRRVQKHVVALRHGDGQMTGALLHMTHGSLQTTWDGTTAAADFLVQHAEHYTESGLYGAGMTGRDGYVLTIGRMPTYHTYIETIAERYEDAFHHPVSFIPL